MIHERLLEQILRHTSMLDEVLERGIDWADTLQVYSVLHAPQIHAQATIDYLLHTCAAIGASAETPIRCIEELEQRNIIAPGRAEELKRLVRFRNLIVHGYAPIDLERVKKVFHGRGYRRITEYVLDLHKRLEAEGTLDP